jgi:hypothetical protein
MSMHADSQLLTLLQVLLRAKAMREGYFQTVKRDIGFFAGVSNDELCISSSAASLHAQTIVEDIKHRC